MWWLKGKRERMGEWSKWNYDKDSSNKNNILSLLFMIRFKKEKKTYIMSINSLLMDISILLNTTID